MLKTILTLALSLTVGFCFSQTKSIDTIKTDTIPARLLITNCPTHCDMYEVKGFKVIKPSIKATYLDADKKRFTPNVVVWMDKPLD